MGKNQDLKRLALQSIVFSMDAVRKKIVECCEPLPVLDCGSEKIPEVLARPTYMVVENVEVKSENESVVSLASAVQVLATAYAHIERGK